jgi:hypothetical protein
MARNAPMHGATLRECFDGTKKICVWTAALKKAMPVRAGWASILPMGTQDSPYIPVAL